MIPSDFCSALVSLSLSVPRSLLISSLFPFPVRLSHALVTRKQAEQLITRTACGAHTLLLLLLLLKDAFFSPLAPSLSLIRQLVSLSHDELLFPFLRSINYISS